MFGYFDNAVTSERQYIKRLGVCKNGIHAYIPHIKRINYVDQTQPRQFKFTFNADPRKKALLLHFAGPIVHDIYETLSPDTIGDNYADTLKVLND